MQMRYRQPMFRLVHISDPHLGPLPKLRFDDYFNKRIIGFLNWKGNRKHHMGGDWLQRLIADFQSYNPDHIAVTGDVTNLALKAEFENGRTWLESLGSGHDVSVIPGNHDAYIRGALKRRQSIWSAFMTGDEAAPGKITFPFLRRRNGVAIIGTSTGVAMPPVLSGGLFGRKQAERLRAMLSDPAIADDFKVVMIHHPPNAGGTQPQKALFDAHLVRRIINKTGADLILHGHTHLASQASVPGPNGPVPVIGVPAASNGTGIIRPPARYNLFEIERSGSAGWSCHWTERGFDSGSGDLVTFRDRQLIAK